MLEKSKKSKRDELTPYDCALQLKNIIVASNLAPIITMVLFEFLSTIATDSLPKNTSIYNYIERLFAEKFKLVVLKNDPKTNLKSRSRAYLILVLEILVNANLVKGLDVDLQDLEKHSDTSVNVKLSAKSFGVDNRGYEFMDSVHLIKTVHATNVDLINRLTACTIDEIDFIISKQEAPAQYDEEFAKSDIIVIDEIQA